MFLPTTPEELNKLAISQLDIIIVTGDTYIDSPYIGAAVLGRCLEAEGYSVGIIAQPDINNPADIARLGEPRLYWGVTAGSVDSMVANYTALGKKRRQDDYTPGGENNRRPDRASIAYVNLIRRAFKNTAPVVLGGIEASLRRFAHYDSHTGTIRRPILFDAKADILLYGMAETAALELARALKDGQDWHTIRGLCYAAKVEDASNLGFTQLPAYDTVKADTPEGKKAFQQAFHLFYQNTDALNAKGLWQAVDARACVQNPPSLPLTTARMDELAALPYERAVHPFYAAQGPVRALDTIRFSLTTHRGCYGECNFCAITVHQGRTVQNRSQASIIKEAEAITKLHGFKGYLLDVGGPTANMYGFECAKKIKSGACQDKRCTGAAVCPSLRVSHREQISLLRSLRQIPGIKKAFVASGIRTDLIMADKTAGQSYVEELAAYHVSGQLKLAPEHSEPQVLKRMGKHSIDSVVGFKRMFEEASRKAGHRQFLTYYFIAAHPGCTRKDMEKLRAFALNSLQLSPEQVQVFTPTPSTYSTLMYYTACDPWTSEEIFVEKGQKGKEEQKEILTGQAPRQDKGYTRQPPHSGSDQKSGPDRPAGGSRPGSRSRR